MYNIEECYLDNNLNPCTWDFASDKCLSARAPKTCEDIEDTSITTHADCELSFTNCTVN